MGEPATLVESVATPVVTPVARGMEGKLRGLLRRLEVREGLVALTPT